MCFLVLLFLTLPETSCVHEMLFSATAVVVDVVVAVFVVDAAAAANNDDDSDSTYLSGCRFVQTVAEIFRPFHASC